MNRIRIIYPYDGYMSFGVIEDIFRDAVLNNEMSHDYIDAHDPLTMAEGLADMGFITLHKDQSQ